MDSLALPILADDIQRGAGVVSFFVVDALVHALLPFGCRDLQNCAICSSSPPSLMCPLNYPQELESAAESPPRSMAVRFGVSGEAHFS